MLLSRPSGAWPYCADYSSGNLKVAVDVWECEVYGVFLVRAVDPNLKLGKKVFPPGFYLTNDIIQEGFFEMNGEEYEIVVGSVLDQKYYSLIGRDNIFPLTFERDPGVGYVQCTYNVFELPIRKDNLKDLLDGTECIVMTTHGNQGMIEYLESIGDDDPEKFEYSTEANQIGWEKEGVTLCNARYSRDGICEHKIPWTQ